MSETQVSVTLGVSWSVRTASRGHRFLPGAAGEETQSWSSYRFLLPLVPLLLLRVLLLEGELGNDLLQAGQRLLPVGLQLPQQRRVRQRRIFSCGVKRRRRDGTTSGSKNTDVNVHVKLFGDFMET